MTNSRYALCVAFDRKAPTFRHLAYAGYKAKRHAMPEELAMQMPVLKEILAAMHIPTYELDGWEADDLLGTISRTCEQKGWDSRHRHRRQGLPSAGHRPHYRESGHHQSGTDHGEAGDADSV